MAREDLFERGYFETYYRDYARQNPPKKLRFYRELAERAASGIQRPRILDLGCAFGGFLSALNPQWQRFGADVSEFATDLARRAVPGATFGRAGIADIGFPGRFDVITAFDVIEHVRGLDEAAEAIKSRLARGGHFIFMVPVYDGPTGPVVRLLDHDRTHVHRRSRRFWLQWTEQNFVLREWWGIFRYLFPGGVYLHRPTKIWRRFTPAIAVVARNEVGSAEGGEGSA